VQMHWAFGWVPTGFFPVDHEGMFETKLGDRNGENQAGIHCKYGRSYVAGETKPKVQLKAQFIVFVLDSWSNWPGMKTPSASVEAEAPRSK